MSTKMLVLKTSLAVGVDALKALDAETSRNDAVHLSASERRDYDFWLNAALPESALLAAQRKEQISNLPGNKVEQNNNDAIQHVKDLVDRGIPEIDAINDIASELGKNPDDLQLAYVLNVSSGPQNMAEEESVGGVRLKAAHDEQRILEAQLVVLKCVNDYDKNHSSSVGEDNIFTTCVEEVENFLHLPVGILCALQPDLALQLALKQMHDRDGKNMNIDQQWENVVKVAERFGLKDSDFQFAEFLQLLERGGHKL